MEILLFVGALAVLAVLAQVFGADSRDLQHNWGSEEMAAWVTEAAERRTWILTRLHLGR